VPILRTEPFIVYRFLPFAYNLNKFLPLSHKVSIILLHSRLFSDVIVNYWHRLHCKHTKWLNNQFKRIRNKKQHKPLKMNLIKKTLLTLALASAFVSTGLAQGSVLWNNPNNSKISINSVLGGAPTGLTLANAGTMATTYYYALFYSTTASTVGGISTAIMPTGGVNGTYAFQDSNWTFLNPAPISGYVTGPAYGTNGFAGRFTPENLDLNHSRVTITANTTPAYWVVLGWSASLGTSLADLATTFNNGSPTANGWIGESAVSALLTPGDPTTTPEEFPQGVFPGAFTLGIPAVSEFVTSKQGINTLQG
jgi:hypothetical protein